MGKSLKEMKISEDLLELFIKRGWSDERIIREGRYVFHHVKHANTVWQRRLVEQMKSAEAFRTDIDNKSFCVASFCASLFGDDFGPRSWEELINHRGYLYETYENLTGADKIVEFLQNEFNTEDAYILINHFGLDTGKPVDYFNMGINKMAGQGAINRIRRMLTPERIMRFPKIIYDWEIEKEAKEIREKLRGKCAPDEKKQLEGRLRSLQLMPYKI